MACVPGRVLGRADGVFTKHKETVREVLKGPALRIVVAELAESVAKDILLTAIHARVCQYDETKGQQEQHVCRWVEVKDGKDKGAIR